MVVEVTGLKDALSWRLFVLCKDIGFSIEACKDLLEDYIKQNDGDLVKVEAIILDMEAKAKANKPKEAIEEEVSEPVAQDPPSVKPGDWCYFAGPSDQTWYGVVASFQQGMAKIQTRDGEMLTPVICLHPSAPTMYFETICQKAEKHLGWERGQVWTVLGPIANNRDKMSLEVLAELDKFVDERINPTADDGTWQAIEEAAKTQEQPAPEPEQITRVELNETPVDSWPEILFKYTPRYLTLYMGQEAKQLTYTGAKRVMNKYRKEGANDLADVVQWMLENAVETGNGEIPNCLQDKRATVADWLGIKPEPAVQVEPAPVQEESKQETGDAFGAFGISSPEPIDPKTIPGTASSVAGDAPTTPTSATSAKSANSVSECEQTATAKVETEIGRTVDAETGEVLDLPHQLQILGWSEYPQLGKNPTAQELNDFEGKLEQVTDKICSYLERAARYRKQAEERAAPLEKSAGHWELFAKALAKALAVHRLPRVKTGPNAGNFTAKTLKLSSGNWAFSKVGGTSIFNFDEFKKKVEEDGVEKHKDYASFEIVVNYKKALAAVKEGKLKGFPGVKESSEDPLGEVKVKL